jgi:hypothetical protein
MAYRDDISQVTRSRAAAASLGITGEVLGVQPGASRAKASTITAATANAAATITWVTT